MLSLGSCKCNSWGQSVGINHAVGQLPVYVYSTLLPMQPRFSEKGRKCEIRGHDSAQDWSHFLAKIAIINKSDSLLLKNVSSFVRTVGARCRKGCMFVQSYYM